MPTDHRFYKAQWKVSRVKFDLFYGMFDDAKLVGFSIHTVDKRQGELIVYNSGTVGIPEYRGRNIVNAIPDLIKNGNTKCLREGITENVKAIKLYEGIGFEIGKNDTCYAEIILVETQDECTLREIAFNTVK